MLEDFSVLGKIQQERGWGGLQFEIGELGRGLLTCDHELRAMREWTIWHLEEGLQSRRISKCTGPKAEVSPVCSSKSEEVKMAESKGMGGRLIRDGVRS